MSPEQLESSILWYALQGQLTQQIDSERSILGKSNVPESEVYFDIPDNWSRMLIKDVFSLVNGKAFKPSDWSDKGVPIVRIQNLNDQAAPYNYYEGEIEDKYKLKGGELLFSWSGTPGTSFGAYEWNGGEAVLNQHIFVLHPKIEYNVQYMKYALNGELKIFIEKAHGGVGLKHITKKEFENCSIPVPPIEEQQRIVKKIEQIIPYIERYSNAYEKLEKFNSKFPEEIKKSILQYAIQGKLVEQSIEDGTAEELYSQIQEKYNNAVKDGRLKKIKPFDAISEEDYPFDIPENWKWLYVNDIAFVTKLAGFEYTKYMAGAITDSGEVPIVRAKNIKPNKFMENDCEFISRELSEQLQRCALDSPCVLMTFIGAGIGEVAIFENKRRNHLAPNVAKIVPHVDMNKYMLYYFMSPTGQQEIFKFMKAVAQPSLSMDTIRQVKIPIPPLKEQSRIVAKIEELLPYCDRLMK